MGQCNSKTSKNKEKRYWISNLHLRTINLGHKTQHLAPLTLWRVGGVVVTLAAGLLRQRSSSTDCSNDDSLSEDIVCLSEGNKPSIFSWKRRPVSIVDAKFWRGPHAPQSGLSRRKNKPATITTYVPMLHCVPQRSTGHLLEFSIWTGCIDIV